MDLLRLQYGVAAIETVVFKENFFSPNLMILIVAVSYNSLRIQFRLQNATGSSAAEQDIKLCSCCTGRHAGEDPRSFNIYNYLNVQYIK
jgi:hypothetical protein